MPPSASAGAPSLVEMIPAGARVLEIAEPSFSRAAELRARGARVESRNFAQAREAPAGAFDAILLEGVLERLEDPAAALEELVPRLSPGGVIVASLSNAGHWSVLLGLLGAGGEGAIPLLSAEPRRFFTRPTLTDLFDSAGLEIASVGEIRRGPTPERAALVARLSAYPGASPDLDVAEFLVIARRAAS